jgi:fibronectin type III domain protein
VRLAYEAPFVEVRVLKSLRLAWLLVLVGLALPGCHDNSDGTSMVSTPSSAPASSSTPTSGSATLSWDAPTTDTNGQPLTNLAGYRIYYGQSQTTLSQTVNLSGTGLQTYVIDNLPQGAWYFAIKAVNSAGVESSLSNVVSKTIS